MQYSELVEVLASSAPPTGSRSVLGGLISSNSTLIRKLTRQHQQLVGAILKRYRS
ncbi:hypothetical protein IWQ61_002600 [Dispira simplex]|nr:hypothetical protein IWQ61_002600 [Dispira simplex]